MKPVERIAGVLKRYGSWGAPLAIGAFAFSLPAYALVFTNALAASPLLPAALAPLV